MSYSRKPPVKDDGTAATQVTEEEYENPDELAFTAVGK